MLNKLIKYDFKSMSKWFLPSYLFLILVTIANCILLTMPISENKDIIKASQIIQSIVMGIYILSIFAISCITLFLIVCHFYKSMVTSEGYLTHTLPVSTSKLIWGKLISATIWTLFTCILFIGSVFCMFFSAGIWEDLTFSNIANVFQACHEVFQIIVGEQLPAFVAIIELLLFILVGFFYSILRMYTAIAIGQLFAKQKILASILAYFILGFINNLLGTIMIFIPFVSKYYGYINSLNQSQVTPNLILQPVLTIGIISTITLCIIYFFITQYIFSKKLNLE